MTYLLNAIDLIPVLSSMTKDQVQALSDLLGDIIIAKGIEGYHLPHLMGQDDAK